MIYQLVALSALLAVNAFDFSVLKHDREFYEEKFVNYLKEHAVEARDGAHFLHMLHAFATNVDFIEKHNASPEGKQYTLGLNHFAHMSFEEWKNYVKLGLGKPDHTPSANVHHAVNATSNPSSIDWTTKGAVTPVKDQGSCGSCWSFSTTGALEGAYQIKSGSLVSLSEQNLVDCDPIDSGCNGGLMDRAFTFTSRNGGLCSEADYPYTSGTTQTEGTCAQDSCTLISGVAPKSHTDVSESDDDLMSALAQQPVSVAIQANQPAFQFYQSGVMTGTCGDRLDHGVLAVGYGTDSGEDFYKVKNSWGSGWGEGGYIRLGRGSEFGKSGQCGILSGPPSYPTL